MSRPVSNVDILTDSFEIWLLQTNELLNAYSTDIITANTTYANTGNSAVFRTSQLYGKFGANTLVATDSIRGGNVSTYANLYVSTNAIVQNTSTANISLTVANGSVFSYINPIGGYFGNTAANTVANQTAVVVQSNATVNTNISATLVQVVNSTASANMTPNAFRAGLFTGNTLSVSIGANVIANASALYIGNSTVNAVTTQSNLVIANSTHQSLLNQESFQVGNSSINAIANSTIITIANSTSSANVTPGSFKTGIFTGNTTTISVGANVVANATSYFVGNSTVNIVVTQNNITSAANLTVTTTLATFSAGVTVTGAAILSNAAVVTGNATFSNTVAVTGNTTFSNTVAVTGNVNMSNTLTVVGTVTHSNTVAVTGNATFSNVVTVTGATTLSNTVAVTGNATLSNTLAVTGAVTLSNTVTVTGIANLVNNVAVGGSLVVTGTTSHGNTTTFQTDYVLDVSANANIGVNISTPVLIYSFPKISYSSGKFVIQVKNGTVTQSSEMVLAQDGGSNSYVTVYGTVASNGASAPLGTFSTAINTANVELYLSQTVANSAVKVAAHLIK